MGLPLVLLNRRRQGGAFSPTRLFALAEPGVWYDPSDLTTLFTDTAGTTPVTTPGQTVALALDKSKGLVLGPELVTNGTFDTNITGWTNFVPSRATVSWNSTLQRLRVDNTTGTGDGYVWANTSVTAGRTYRVSLNQYIVSGSMGLVRVKIYWFNGTVDVGGQISFSTITNNTLSFVAVAPAGATSILIGSDVTAVWELDNISVRELPGFHATQATAASRPTYALMPPSGKRNLLNNTNTLATQTLMMTAAQHTLSFRGTGTVTLSGASTAGPLVGTGASNIVSLTFTPTANNLTLTVSGTVNDAQLELGAARTTYQTVTNDGYNVTEAGVTSLPCLSFNGVNNFLVTPTITPGIDKAQVFAGVRKLSDAVFSVIAEYTADAATISGSWTLIASASTSGAYLFGGRGSSQLERRSDVLTAPRTNVLTQLLDIGGSTADTEVSARINGASASLTTFSGTTLGTGNYANAALYIGRRGGTTLGFNGFLFGLIVRFGANLDANTITNTETWVAGKTGVTL